jgi:hypothetical protein
MSETTRNIQLNISNKVKYTINGDESKFIELNPKDFGISARFGESVPRLNALADQFESLSPSEEEKDDDYLVRFAESFRRIDEEIRQIINFLFDYDVCSVCASDGSMLDLQDGEYRYSVIINTLFQLYEDNISTEMKKMEAAMKKHTDKYTTKDHQRKKN